MVSLRQLVPAKGRAPLVEGLEAFGLGGVGFLGLRGSLLLLRWPFAMVRTFIR